MRIWPLLGWAASACCALAAGYDDFARGIQANEEGKSQLAIAAFTAALAANDLAATYVPTAYYGRALARFRSQDCFAARADAGEALKAKPDYFDAWSLRARLDDCLHDDAAEADDIAKGLALKRDETLLVARGVLKWRRDDFAAAAADFTEAATTPASDSSRYLLSAAAQMHAGVFDPKFFAATTAHAKVPEWPRPLFELYSGKETPDAVLAAAAKGSAPLREFYKCEADFFIGEWHLWRKEPAAAKPMFHDAGVECRNAYFLRRIAIFEFDKLDQGT